MNSNIIITKPTAEEYKKTIKMLNKIFMLSFPVILPKLYGKGKDYSKDHFIVKEDGKIVAAIASVPNTMHVDENELKAKGVGMVGTKYSSRGKGIMTLMLDRIYKEALEDQTDLMFLSGNFNRYNRYGFYPSGIINQYEMRKSKNFINNAKDFRFVKIQGKEEEVKQIKSIYEQEDIRWDRDDFNLVLKNWNKKAYFIYKGQDLKGYFVAGPKNQIFEIITINSNINEIITAWLCQIGRDSLIVETSPYLSETNNQLLANCEKFTQTNIENWSILNWLKVLEVMLNAKLKRNHLKKGRVYVQLDEEKFLLEVDEDVAKVTTTTKECEVILNKGLATRIFFGVNENFKTGSELLDSWLPIPLYISSCDTM